MPAHRLAATNQPLQSDTTELLKTFLYNNYSLIDPAKDTEVKFATNFRDLSNPGYLVIVFPLPKLNTISAAGNARKTINDFKRIYVIANGHAQIEKHWILEEAIYDLIDGSPEGLEAQGIEDMTITEFTPITTISDAEAAQLIADDSLIKASYARVKLTYDKIL